MWRAQTTVPQKKIWSLEGYVINFLNVSAHINATAMILRS
jgi:hypothetical protein